MNSPSSFEPEGANGRVPRDRMVRLRERYGVYHQRHWRVFAGSIGLQVYTVCHPISMAAVLLDGALLVRVGIPSQLTALYAWHELGHAVLHTGNREYWRTQFIGGNYLLRRFERQAWEFALLFPIWDPEDLEEALAGLEALGGVPRELEHAKSIARGTW